MIERLRKLWNRLLGVKETPPEPEIEAPIQEESPPTIIPVQTPIVKDSSRKRVYPIRPPDPNNTNFWAEQLGARMASFYATADVSDPPKLYCNWSSALEYLLYFLERGRRFA